MYFNYIIYKGLHQSNFNWLIQSNVFPFSISFTPFFLSDVNPGFQTDLNSANEFNLYG